MPASLRDFSRTVQVSLTAARDTAEATNGGVRAATLALLSQMAGARQAQAQSRGLGMKSKLELQFADLFRAVVAVAAIMMMIVSVVPVAASELPLGPASGLPIPRFVSLKPDKVNVRGGPTRHHEVTWQYTRSGLPVEITAESDNWRRIRDWEGSEGWVYHSLLSGRRTALVTSKVVEDLIAVHSDAAPDSRVVAQLQAGVIGSVKRCNGKWCQVNGGGFSGWVAQERLWGVYPNEKVD